MVPAGVVKGEINFEAAGDSVCGPVTGNHKYPDFSLDFNFALAGEEVTGGYVGKATIHNCTGKFVRPEWCGMVGTFSTDDGSFSEALTLTLDTRSRPIVLEPCVPLPVPRRDPEETLSKEYPIWLTTGRPDPITTRAR